MIEMRLFVERRQYVDLNDEEKKMASIQYMLEHGSRWRPSPTRRWDYDEVGAILNVEGFMDNLPFSNDEINRVLHFQRADLLHKLEDIPGLEVRDWGRTDDKRTHEAVEIIAALGSAGVITALVNIIKVWIEKDKIKKATIQLPNGAMLTVERATAGEIQDFIANANQLLQGQEAKELPPKKSD